MTLLTMYAFGDAHFLTESLQWILTLDFLELTRGELVQEFVDREISSTNAYLNATFLDGDKDSLGAKSVNALRITHKHNLQFISVGVVVNKLSNFHIDWIIFNWNINGNFCLEINDVAFQSRIFSFQIPNLLEHIQASLVGLKYSFLQLCHILSGIS